MKKLSDVAYHHTSDIDSATKRDANVLTNLVNVCIVRAENALKNALGGYTDFQCAQIAQIFCSMRSTHHNFRKLMDDEADPGSVDSLALARLQLETLYAVCFMLEAPDNVNCYLRDGWHKQYSKFLLRREEFSALPRFANYLTKVANTLETLRQFHGITLEQKMTIDNREIGAPLPQGFVPQPLTPFPTPGKVLPTVTIPDRRIMLERMYPEYVRLCSFAHGLAEATFFKTIFDKRNPVRSMLKDSDIEDTFQKEASDGFLISALSMLQCVTELTTLYPNDIDLKAGAIAAWNELSEVHLLGRALWYIRSRSVLGAI
jgi:hypothetical protein